MILNFYGLSILRTGELSVFPPRTFSLMTVPALPVPASEENSITKCSTNEGVSIHCRIFPPFLQSGRGNFCDFLFASLEDETIPKKGFTLVLQARICFIMSISFFQELTPFKKGGINDGIAAPVNVPVHPKRLSFRSADLVLK